MRYNDPTGHCFEPVSFAICSVGLALIGAAVFIASHNDYQVTRQQPGLVEETQAVQNWQDNCMGQCHYAHAVNPTPGVIVGGERPASPIGDRLGDDTLGMISGISMMVDGAVGLAGATGYIGRFRSAIRYTQEGDEFIHYGYARHAGSYDDGIRAGGFAEPYNGNIRTPAQAGQKLALPHSELPDSYYLVRPAPGTPIQGPRSVAPIFRLKPPFFRTGGGAEVRFLNETGRGTVFGPYSLR